ncbi:lipoprotein [Aquimarina addita]|uniref:Lipoprotein n=1 Tax=Aquimarina addita TaxID=870485 RepID=A0ABP7XAY0_9FLAO
MTTKKVISYVSALFIALILLMSCNDDEGEAIIPDDEFNGEIDWITTYGGSNEDSALSIVETLDGGYAIAGYTFSLDGDITDKTATDSDYWLLKLNPDGTLQWSKTYGGTNDDRATKLIQATDGGFVMVGYSRSNDEDASLNAGLQDYWVIKVNTNGEIIWEKSFGFGGIDQAFSIIQTTDGGYFITGFLDVTASDGGGNDDKSFGTKHGVGEFWGIKLDADGNQEWRRYFGGTNNDRSYDVVQTEDQGFILIGSSESVDFDITNSKGSYDFWVLKINTQGTLVWQKSFGGSEIDVGYTIGATGDGKYIIVGDARSTDGDITSPKGNADLWMIQIDGNGNLLWQKSIGGTEFDTGRGIHKMNNGNFIITGNTRSTDMDITDNKGQADLWNIMINTNGDMIWNTTAGGSKDDFGFSCIETMDQKIVVVGSSESNDADILTNRGSKDILIIKYK